MDAWIGLAGVIAGAVIAFGGQFLMRRSESRESFDALLLEQAAVIVALSEDYRNRVWEERSELAGNVVGGWDIGTYRLAEARLRILSGNEVLLSKLAELHHTGTALGAAWRLEPHNAHAVDVAWATHRLSIDQFIAASSRALHRVPRTRRRHQAGPSTPPETPPHVTSQGDSAKSLASETKEHGSQ